MKLMEGSEAIAEASIAAGCTFFAGYPMTPFTELLEHFARRLPDEGGVCINAESELEAVGMAWGALATGARAATGSTGQGLSLMQESFSEITLAELPLVIFNMARGQQDYFQSTRGGGHGDYRHIVLAPMDIGEAVEHTQLAFHLADKWRTPVLIYGDYLLAHVQEAVDITPLELPPLPPKDWALDGSLTGTGKSRIVSPLGFDKARRPSQGIEQHLRAIVAKQHRIVAEEVRVESGYLDDADTVIVAFGPPGKFVKYVVAALRAEGEKIGYVRPITLWPFPYDAVAAASEGAARVGVFELCAGQMIDDVRLGVLGRAPVTFVGGISTDGSGFGVGPLLDVELIRARILALHRDEPLPPLPGNERQF
jgi:Pyruvate:ferredoxin oxidoreductase and related 2-oxoacid:ferredoxin oxidoreductases, alpha subunit